MLYAFLANAMNLAEYVNGYTDFKRSALSIEQIANAFAQAHSKFGTPDGAFNKCSFASYDLRNQMDKNGIIAVVYQGIGCKGDTSMAVKKWQKLGNPDFWVHYVVEAEDIVIDMTNRQFNPNSAFPLICSLAQFKSQWMNTTNYGLGPAAY